MANMEHYVKANGKTMKLADCMKHYQSLCEKHENEEEEAQKNEDEPKENDETAKDKVLEHEAEEEKVASSADEMAENMDDKEALAKTLELAEHEVEEMRGQKANKKKNSAHFEALKNAEKNSYKMSPVIELSQDKVARGKARYGSN
jgi:cysteinyl-tRNA synthetase